MEIWTDVEVIRIKNVKKRTVNVQNLQFWNQNLNFKLQKNDQ